MHTFEGQGVNVRDVKCQALSPQRDARPSYGVPSGPFSSTCQNETSSARSDTASEAIQLAGVGGCGGLDSPSHGHTSIEGCGFLEYACTYDGGDTFVVMVMVRAEAVAILS